MAWRLGRTRVRQTPQEKAKTIITEPLVTVSETNRVAAEAYRTLCTNLLYGVVADSLKVVVVTSSNPREGKSNTCANLGATLAQAGKNTLIIDCDFRKPHLHTYFGLQNLHGIIDVLAGQRDLQEVWREPVEGLKVISVGPPPPNPAAFLDSRRFTTFLAGVRKEFDYVLLDTPPLGAVSDATILATKADGVLLVVDLQNTRKRDVGQSVRSLELVGANIIGTVVNKVKGAKNGYYHYGYPRK